MTLLLRRQAAPSILDSDPDVDLLSVAPVWLVTNVIPYRWRLSKRDSILYFGKPIESGSCSDGDVSPSTVMREFDRVSE